MRPRHSSSPDVHAWSVRPAWYALYTHARRERKVVEALDLAGIRCFFPVIPRRRRWHDRRKIVSWPLFPSYVFARVDPQAIPLLIRIDGIADIVRFGHRPTPIPDEEIANIVRFVNTLGERGSEVMRVPYMDGERVRVTTGPYEGLEGVVVAADPMRVMIGIQAIGMGFEVEVSEGSLTTLH